jgi:hypothetical protein
MTLTFEGIAGRGFKIELLYRRSDMSIILVVILVVLLIGAVPSWPYSRNWGYYPSGGIGLILLIILILLLLGRI